jgi:L-serine dehydratase
MSTSMDGSVLPDKDLTFAKVVVLAERAGGLALAARAMESATTRIAVGALDRLMAERLAVMREAAERGCAGPVISRTGTTGGDGFRLWAASGRGGLAGEPLTRAVARALAIAEVNAAMGRIVAAPTAGSCGIVPGVLLTVAEQCGLGDDKIVDGLWVAGLVGQVIQGRIALSGAQGGCQAECGAAAAMAAAAACHLAGGDALASTHAAAIALKNLLGLVCDPVAGLVEVPCIKRNAGGVAIAFAAAEMALAGIRSVIPPDEVVMAMAEIGHGLPLALRETGDGGLAATFTGRAIAAALAEDGDLGTRQASLDNKVTGSDRQC